MSSTYTGPGVGPFPSDMPAVDDWQQTLEDALPKLLRMAKARAGRLWASAPAQLEHDELTGLASLGLAHALERWPKYCADNGYDPGELRYFWAYALRRINGTMLDALRTDDHVTRTARNVVRKVREALAGRESLPDDELAELTGIPARQIKAAMAAEARKPVSLNNLMDTTDGVVAGSALETAHTEPLFGAKPAHMDVEASAFANSIHAAAVGAIGALDEVGQVMVALVHYEGHDLTAAAESVAQLRLCGVKAAQERYYSAVASVHEAMLLACR